MKLFSSHSVKTLSDGHKITPLVLKMGLNVAVTTVVLITCLITITSLVTRKRTIQDFESMAGEVAYARSFELYNWLNCFQNDLKFYTDADFVQQASSAEIGEWLSSQAEKRNPEFETVFYVDLKGSTWRDTGEKNAEGSVLSADYMAGLLAGSPFVFGSCLQSKISGNWVIPVSRAVTRTDINAAGEPVPTVTGAFVALVNAGNLDMETAMIAIAETGDMALVDPAGRVVSSKNPSISRGFYPKGSGVAEAVAAGADAVIYEKDADGIPCMFTVRPFMFYPTWRIVIRIPMTRVQSVAVTLLKISLLVAVIIELLLFIITLIPMIWLTRDVADISGRVHTIASGSGKLTDVMKIGQRDEMALLRDSWNLLQQKLIVIINSIYESRESISGMAQGIDDANNTIFGITGSINTVRAAVERQGASVDGTATSVTEISQNIESLNNMIQNQSASVVQASAAIEQMLGNISAITTTVDKMSGEFSHLTEQTNTSITKNASVNAQVQEIAKQSTMLMEANKVIENIASQTNLLAMNAAIEAAHAGEVGRGFSVVASEIRKLAEESSKQSSVIGEELKNIQQSIDTVVQTAEDSTKAMGGVSSRITATGQLLSQIHGGMDEQQEGSKQILQALQSVNDVTGQVKTASAEMEKGNEEILKEVAALKNATREIESAMGSINKKTEDMTQVTENLKSIAFTVNDAIDTIYGQVDKYQITED
ncbi:MAG: methyl-accepting chemotaxis protein [Treponemataceae bacterium]|nr:methyl-accepting chemotaxis protein [Treponemataceae bacterium]